MYRDRADCENGFDELKNQWGWGGYSTQDIERCNLSASVVALVHNWWSWYCRLAHPKARLELGAVGKSVEHAGQHRMLVSIMNGAVDKVKALTANIRAGLAHIRATAPQLKKSERWKALVDYIVEKIIAENAKRRDQPAGSTRIVRALADSNKQFQQKLAPELGRPGHSHARETERPNRRI